MRESLEDFSYEENEEYSNIITEGIRPHELEVFEQVAEEGFSIIDQHPGVSIRYKGATWVGDDE